MKSIIVFKSLSWKRNKNIMLLILLSIMIIVGIFCLIVYRDELDVGLFVFLGILIPVSMIFHFINKFNNRIVSISDNNYIKIPGLYNFASKDRYNFYERFFCYHFNISNIKDISLIEKIIDYPKLLNKLRNNKIPTNFISSPVKLLCISLYNPLNKDEKSFNKLDEAQTINIYISLENPYSFLDEMKRRISNIQIIYQ